MKKDNSFIVVNMPARSTGRSHETTIMIKKALDANKKIVVAFGEGGIERLCQNFKEEYGSEILYESNSDKKWYSISYKRIIGFLNRENSSRFKELGFDIPTYAAHVEGNDGVTFVIYPHDENNNKYERALSAPDFITAADFLFKRNKVVVKFHPKYTEVIAYDCQKEFIPIIDPDHRNAGIDFAIQQIIKFANKQK